jgi:ADP-ribose pyrophosphatase
MADEHPDFTEEEISSRVVYEGRLLHVREDEVRLPDGRHARREYIRHPGAVMVIALTDAGDILLEHQYRYPLRRHFIELPAGKLDGGESPLACAQRELVEECGFEAGEWRHLATTHPCIGYSDERIELFLARDLRHVGHARDDGEFIEVLAVPVARALEWLRAGRITDTKALIGLLWADRILRGEWE